MKKLFILLTLTGITLLSAQCAKDYTSSLRAKKKTTTNTPIVDNATIDDILGKTIEIEALGCKENPSGFNENALPANQKGGLFDIGCFRNWATNNETYGTGTNAKVSRGKFYVKFEKTGNSYDMLSWSTDPLLREQDTNFRSNIARPFFYLGDLNATNRLSEITRNTLLFQGTVVSIVLGNVVLKLNEVKNRADKVDISLTEGGKKVQLLFTSIAGDKGSQYDFTITGDKSDPTTIKVHLKFNITPFVQTDWSDPANLNFSSMALSVDIQHFDATTQTGTIPLEYVVNKIN